MGVTSCLDEFVLLALSSIPVYIVYHNTVYGVELKQISESVGYPFETYYPDPEPFRIVANYFKQF